jgi:predicted nuclease with TOPRIM domain
MANELQQTLTRIINKSNIFVEKYHELEKVNGELMSENEQLVKEIEQIKRDNEKLSQEIEFLKMARVVAPNLDNVENARTTISTLVRDIDKCIAQLNE